MSDFYKLLTPKQSLAILIGYPRADRVRAIVNSGASLVVVVEDGEKEAADAEAEFYGKPNNVVIVERSSIGFDGGKTPIDALIDSYGTPNIIEVGNKEDAIDALETITYPVDVISFHCENEADAIACAAWVSALGEYQYHVVGVDNEYTWPSPRVLGFLEGFKGKDEFLAWMSRTAVFNSPGRLYAVRVKR